MAPRAARPSSLQPPSESHACSPPSLHFHTRVYSHTHKTNSCTPMQHVHTHAHTLTHSPVLSPMHISHTSTRPSSHALTPTSAVSCMRAQPAHTHTCMHTVHTVSHVYTYTLVQPGTHTLPHVPSRAFTHTLMHAHPGKPPGGHHSSVLGSHRVPGALRCWRVLR